VSTEVVYYPTRVVPLPVLTRLPS